jgi:hypothetical protein
MPKRVSISSSVPALDALLTIQSIPAEKSDAVIPAFKTFWG